MRWRSCCGRVGSREETVADPSAYFVAKASPSASRGELGEMGQPGLEPGIAGFGDRGVSERPAFRSQIRA
jgi:hypothetical protein